MFYNLRARNGVAKTTDCLDMTLALTVDVKH